MTPPRSHQYGGRGVAWLRGGAMSSEKVNISQTYLIERSDNEHVSNDETPWWIVSIICGALLVFAITTIVIIVYFNYNLRKQKRTLQRPAEQHTQSTTDGAASKVTSAESATESTVTTSKPATATTSTISTERGDKPIQATPEMKVITTPFGNSGAEGKQVICQSGTDLNPKLLPNVSQVQSEAAARSTEVSMHDQDDHSQECQQRIERLPLLNNKHNLAVHEDTDEETTF